MPFGYIFGVKSGYLRAIKNRRSTQHDEENIAAYRASKRETIPTPVYAYAVETAIQLTLTELKENLREIYLEAYSLPDTAEYIYLHTTAELKQIFGGNFPGQFDGISTKYLLLLPISFLCCFPYTKDKRKICLFSVKRRDFYGKSYRFEHHFLPRPRRD